MSIPSSIPDSSISVIRDIAIDFMNRMMNEKTEIVQMIKAKSEEIRSMFAQSGQSTFTFADVDAIMKEYKSFFVDFYENTIYLRLISQATHNLKEGIEEGYYKSGIIKEEVLTEYRRMQQQLSEKGSTDAMLTDFEQQLLNQTEQYSDIQSENHRMRNEINLLNDQLREKQTELENVQTSLKQLDAQLNTLGTQLLNANGELEEIQTAYHELTQQNEQYVAELKRKEDLEKELEEAKQMIRDLSLREQELMANQKITSSGFVDQLQEDLERARNELYALKAERVEKNEEYRRIKFELDEKQIAINHLSEYKESTSGQLTESKMKIDELTTEVTDLQKLYDSTKETLEEKIAEQAKLQSKIAEMEEQIFSASEEIKTYRGKAVVSEDILQSYTESLDYFKQILSYDPKFRVLTIIDSFKEEVQLKDISTATGLPAEIVHRSVVELADAGYINVRRDGALIFISVTESSRAPFALDKILAQSE